MILHGLIYAKLLELNVFTDQYPIQNTIPRSMLLHIAGEIYPSSNVWYQYMFTVCTYCVAEVSICLKIGLTSQIQVRINPLTSNDLYISRTAPLISKRRILYIYSTNVGTEYFKHALYSPFFFLFKMQFVS